MFEESEHPTEGMIRQMRPTTNWSDADVSIRRHAPSFGEHSIEVLREVGYSDEEIADMLSKGVTLNGSSIKEAPLS